MATRALTAASTKPLILSILTHGENYGYHIIREIERLSEGELAWTDAMLYPVLARMEKEGLVRSQWVQRDGGRKRKYYRITDEGRAQLERERAQWLRVNQVFLQLWGLGEAYVPHTPLSVQTGPQPQNAAPCLPSTTTPPSLPSAGPSPAAPTSPPVSTPN